MQIALPSLYTESLVPGQVLQVAAISMHVRFGLAFRRRDPIIVIGGGVCLDVAGLAANLYRRNTPLIKVFLSAFYLTALYPQGSAFVKPLSAVGLQTLCS